MGLHAFVLTDHQLTLENRCPIIQGSPVSGIYHLMIWGGADVIIIEIKCPTNVMHLNHPETIPSLENLSSTKPVPDAKNVGDPANLTSIVTLNCPPQKLLQITLLWTVYGINSLYLVSVMWDGTDPSSINCIRFSNNNLSFMWLQFLHDPGVRHRSYVCESD